LLVGLQLVEQEDLQEEANRLKSSLCDFVEAAWPLIDSHKFVREPHIEALCAHLEAVYRGEIRTLIINIPPRCSKSTIVGVLFPVWCWLQEPGLQFLTAAREKTLAARDSVTARALIQSRWFQARWPYRPAQGGQPAQGFRLLKARNTQTRYHNSAGGHRIAVTVGKGTGDGGDILLVDDPTTAEGALSKTTRETANRWADNTIATRFNDAATGRMVLIMQRLHDDDMTGHLLRTMEGDVVHLRLPMEYEPDDPCITVPLPGTNGKPWRDWRREKGELLAPKRFPPAEVVRLKKRLVTSFNVAGQLQQRPMPQGGEILRAGWWVVWVGDGAPKREYTLISVDTAMSEDIESAAGSAITAWGVYIDHQEKVDQRMVLLLQAWRESVTFNTLVEKIDEYARRWRAEKVLVEAKANGISVVQELRRRFRWAERAIETVNPTVDKIARAYAVQGMFESGYVAAPKRYRRDDNGEILLGAGGDPIIYTPDWVKMVVDECSMFPRGRYADLTDTTTQAIAYLRRRFFEFYAEDSAPPARRPPGVIQAHY
jgi:phage terminase large subunit-like protein